jgi:hypothetical protein
MSYYISLEGVQELTAAPENLGYTKAEFLEGKSVEIDAELVSKCKSLFEQKDGENITIDTIADTAFPVLYYYIKNKNILKLSAPLSETRYNIGYTYVDYIKGAFVPLSDEQVDFYLHHQGESIKNIFDMKTSSNELTIDQVRAKKILKLEQYDSSVDVNSFTLNGVNAWLDASTRSNYLNSINAAEVLGFENLSFYIGENEFEVSVALAKQMLASIQLYADQCYIVTMKHKVAIESLETIEDIDAYDITTGYPEKLIFNL